MEKPELHQLLCKKAVSGLVLAEHFVSLMRTLERLLIEQSHSVLGGRLVRVTL